MRRLLHALSASLVLAALPAVAQGGKIVMEEFMVPAKDAGIEIYVRNKRPEGMAQFSPEKTVVFVHGATYPAHTAFDLQLAGQSWMDFIASRGFDVYLLDLRGYGKSTRPKEMDAPAEANDPIVDTATARRDVGAVVDHVLQRRGIQKVNLLGWSWGTSIMASYAAENPQKVERLVLYAPQWLRTTPSLVQVQGKLGAYRTVKREAAKERWLTGVPEDKKAELIPAGWFEAWADATFASDPVGAAQNPPVLRAPNGVVKDGNEYWSAGKPLYDPGNITVPTMLVLGEWDRDTPPYMAQTLFPLLTNAPAKKLVMLGEGTHTIIMEKNRLQLFNAVQQFLEEKLNGAPS
ncbi:MAG TPA: alpha/beta hydrolase [Beijerinckiaceae bacterium]|jgi:pimeloyl-ACP methyl ester carboxylesterase